MRVALIYPATDFDLQFHRDSLSNGLMSLAASVETDPTRQVNIFDRRHTLPLPPAEDYDRYDVIGFTAMSMQVLHAIALVQELRRRGYRGRIVFGGPHATVACEHLKTVPEIDAIFLGEGEESFPAYLSHLEGRESRLGRLWMRDAGGCWQYPGDLDFVDDLDRLPWPARHKFAQVLRKKKFINVLTARGCPYNCNFCQPSKRILFGKRVRRRSPANIFAEIQQALREYGITAFSIDDDTFTFDERALKEFCDLVAPLGLLWSCQSRSDISKETLIAMKGAGCWLVFVGVESGSQRHARPYGKEEPRRDEPRLHRMVSGDWNQDLVQHHPGLSGRNGRGHATDPPLRGNRETDPRLRESSDPFPGNLSLGPKSGRRP